jgi:acyl carrier protein phosphodiesterase
VNFLAHIYLSGNSSEILIGNFIGDYVKGREYIHYPDGIQKGIMLHRHIDSYTDRHPVTRSSKKYISERYGKYSGIVVDIFYDHFLSSRWDLYSEMPFRIFIKDRYKKLDSGSSYFPMGVKNWFPYFIKSNWLETYTSFEGLAMVFKRMSYRTTLPDHSDYAVSQLRHYYDELGAGFSEFFNAICRYVESEFDISLESVDQDG